MAALFSCFVDACDARRLASIRFANKGRSEADRISDERRDSVPRGQLRLPNQNPFDSSATAATGDLPVENDCSDWLCRGASVAAVAVGR
jgi:hypothetical protein